MPDRTLSPAEKQANYRAAYEKRDVNLLVLYEQCMRALSLQLETVETRLTSGMAYKEGLLDKDLVKFSCDIAKTIKELTKLHIQVQSRENAKNSKPLSLEEKKQHATVFIASLPPGHRNECLDVLSDMLMYKWERKNPVGAPPKGFVHPLDKS